MNVNMLTITRCGPRCKLTYMALNDRIKTARELIGLTQEELAVRVGVSRPAVVMWENGKTKTIEGENLVRTAYVTRVDPLWLATGEGEMQPRFAVREEPEAVPHRFVDAWRRIDDRMREHLIAITEALAAKT